MQGTKLIFLYFFGMVGLCMLPPHQAHSQVMYAGLKSGFQASWTKHDDTHTTYDDLYKIYPVPGFNFGGVFSFKVRDRYFLHTECLFSTKGRTIRGRADKELKDRLIYYYVEVPLMYNVFFDAKLRAKQIKQFKWYVGIGPNFSYWLGGKGKIYNTEFSENSFPALEYKLKFGERGEDQGEKELIYIRDAKRLQLGLNIGGGILLEPINGRKYMIDLRFELGHTWLGKERSADYVIPVDYTEGENLRDRNMGIRLSFMYMFESSLDKKTRNKGKSTKKVKRNRL